jgi:hypothetical protein
MWLKNRVNWTEREAQKWELMVLEWWVTGTAYYMRTVLQGIAARMVEGHMEGILPYQTRWLTTFFKEGLNSLFPAVMSDAHGYRSVEYITIIPFFVALKLTRPVLLTF